MSHLMRPRSSRWMPHLRLAQLGSKQWSCPRTVLPISVMSYETVSNVTNGPRERFPMVSNVRMAHPTVLRVCVGAARQAPGHHAVGAARRRVHLAAEHASLLA